MVSGRGSEWRTMAPYRPYSAIIVDRPQHFSVFRHLALLFWNQTWNIQTKPIKINMKHWIFNWKSRAGGGSVFRYQNRSSECGSTRFQPDEEKKESNMK